MVTASPDHRPQRLLASGPDLVPPSSAEVFDTGGIRASADRIVENLNSEFPTASPDTVRAVVETIAAQYRNARVSSYVAILVERESRERLRSAGLPRQRTWRDHQD